MNDVSTIYTVEIGDGMDDLVMSMSFTDESDAIVVRDFYDDNSDFNHVAIVSTNVNPNIQRIRDGLSAFVTTVAKDGSIVSCRNSPQHVFNDPSCDVVVRDKVPDGQLVVLGHYTNRAHAELAAKAALHDSLANNPSAWPATPDKPQGDGLEGMGAWA